VAKSLVIVESPAKAKTIGKFLGSRYMVKASMGHIRDLPKSQFGVDIENNFTPKYINIRGKGDLIKQLRTEANKADKVYLATDLDREGEAISWHLAELLKVDKNSPCRIEFNEITKDAIKASLKKARPININRVNAQQARRVLDRLVGYKISPLLWKKVKKGLSAGRVQSVAVRLICQREEEIEKFIPEEYWSITASFQVTGKKQSFFAKLQQKERKKLAIKNAEEAKSILQELEGAEYLVKKVKKSERKKNPTPPFTTSTLQQEASRKLGFTAKKTMRIAQQLYEGLEVGAEGSVGLITYMRTDSTRISDQAQGEAREFIQENYGKNYLPAAPRKYKAKEDAQDAHEAIRPTSAFRQPSKIKEYLSRDQYRLYKLIWERFLSSQMASAVLDTLTVDIQANSFLFRANGSNVKFPGFMVIYVEGEDDVEKKEEGLLPELTEGQILQLISLEDKQHFTQPPPRYTEATLVKDLEEKRIGRPSTYAPIIDTIQERGYVILEDKRFYSTELGKIVNYLLVKHFPRIMDAEFTAEMEDYLDKIAAGEVSWLKVLQEFYQPFAGTLEKAEEQMEKIEIKDEVTDQLCEHCGRNLVIKQGRYGKFMACPGFPECRNTKPILKEIGIPCPQCQKALVERKTKRGRKFYGCSNYPECTFITWDQPVKEICPQCGSFLLLAKGKKGKGDRHYCSKEGCDYQKTEEKGIDKNE